jgi:hypothetical protein
MKEVSIMTAIWFFRRTYKTILFFTFIGFFFSAYYFQKTPNRYEVISLIKINQIPTREFQAINIDNIDSHIARLSTPSAYTQNIIDNCGFKELQAPKFYRQPIQVSLLSGTISILEVRFKVTTRNAAKPCSLAIYDLIKNEEIRSFDSRAGVIKNELIKLKKVLKNKYDSVEIDRLLVVIKSYEDFLNSKTKDNIQIISIYVSDYPVNKKIYKVIGIGSFIGMLLGLWSCIAFEIIKNLCTKKRLK